MEQDEEKLVKHVVPVQIRHRCRPRLLHQFPAMVVKTLPISQRIESRKPLKRGPVRVYPATEVARPVDQFTEIVAGKLVLIDKWGSTFVPHLGGTGYSGKLRMDCDYLTVV